MAQDEGTTTFPRKRRGSTMLGSFRSNVTVGIAVLAGIAGLSYVLAASAAPPGGTTAPVEFTADGKLKQPVGYRKWVYVGEVVTPNDLNDGEASRLPFHQEPPRQPKSQIRSKHDYWQLHTRRGFGR